MRLASRFGRYNSIRRERPLTAFIKELLLCD